MAQLSTTTFCLVLGCLTLSLSHYSSSSSSSSGSEKEKQFCGTEKFYCPTNKQCLDRDLRCTSNVCVEYNNDARKCGRLGTSGMYEYYKKKTSLFSSGSKRKRRSELAHWFVDYRGFVYEFGSSYGVQELDVNDPNYKYGPGGTEVIFENFMGTSSCTRDEVLSFVNKWIQANPNYNLFVNNCQHFAIKLLKELENNCPNRVRRQDDDTESLKAPRECFSNTSSSFRWKLHTLFAPLISFAIFHNIN